MTRSWKKRGNSAHRHAKIFENAATFAPQLQKKQGLIEWEKSAEEIERKVRAMQPWPGAFTYIDGKMLKICKAKVVSDLECAEKPGCVCESKKFIVSTGTGAIQVEEVQPEGKRVMKTAHHNGAGDLGSIAGKGT